MRFQDGRSCGFNRVLPCVWSIGQAWKQVLSWMRRPSGWRRRPCQSEPNCGSNTDPSANLRGSSSAQLFPSTTWSYIPAVRSAQSWTDLQRWTENWRRGASQQEERRMLWRMRHCGRHHSSAPGRRRLVCLQQHHPLQSSRPDWTLEGSQREICPCGRDLHVRAC